MLDIIYRYPAIKDLLFHRDSVILPTERSILPYDSDVWNHLTVENQPLLPEILAGYFPSYRNFNPIDETRTIYSNNGIPSFPDGPVVVALLAPPATGKDTLLDETISFNGQAVTKILTTTGRPKRPGEINGITYRFRMNTELMMLDAVKGLAEGVIQGGNIYGTEKLRIRYAMHKPQRLKVWRGDLRGLQGFRAHVEQAHPDAAIVVIGINPGLSIQNLDARIDAKRGTGREQLWRKPKARWEFEQMPKDVDLIVMNYPESTEKPVHATEALTRIFATLIQEPLRYQDDLIMPIEQDHALFSHTSM